MISLYHNKPQIIRLPKHHLKTEEIKNINLDQYVLGAFSCRKKYKCGGVCIYISLQFSAINLENYHKEKDFEICALKLNVQKYNFIIICIYKSPTGDFTHFRTQLGIIMNDLHNTSNEFILCGDLIQITQLTVPGNIFWTLSQPLLTFLALLSFLPESLSTPVPRLIIFM